MNITNRKVGLASDAPSLRKPRDCPVEDWLNFLGHRWNALLLWHLSVSPKRHGELITLLPGINLAKTLGVKMRVDVLRTATQQLMDTAAATQTYTSQFRMAIYDFGASVSTAGLRSLFALSSSLSSAKTAAGNIDLMTANGHSEYQGTRYTTLLPAINSVISSPGTGTSSAPLKYLFFVSDGVADENNSACLKPKTGSRCQSPINPALCTVLKDRGIKIAVLYTTYLDLPTNSWYNSWIKPFNTGPYNPASVNSEIAKKMEACASPGFYFEVNPTQGISEAMNALFQKAVSDARIAS